MISILFSVCSFVFDRSLQTRFEVEKIDRDKRNPGRETDEGIEIKRHFTEFQIFV